MIPTVYCTITVLLLLIIWMPPIIYSSGINLFQIVDPKDIPLTETLQTSTYLLVTHISCLTSLLALALGIFMDICAKNATISTALHLKERCLMFLALTVTSIIYLSFRTNKSIALFYVAANYSRGHILFAAVYTAVYSELKEKACPYIINGVAASFMLWEVSATIGIYATYYHFSTMDSIMFVLQSIGYCIGVIAIARWIFIVIRNKRNNGMKVSFENFTLEENSGFAYAVPIPIYIPITLLWSIATNDYSWNSRSELNCVFIMCVHILYGIYTITVPGRIVRQLATINMEMLRLKQTFVRCVSHEIRSPLSVVHAGLDILKAKVKVSNNSGQVIIDADTVELVEQIFSSSGTSIDILDDLLVYEHIDSGTFHLELSWHPMAHFLAGKFEWVKILADKKSVKVVIEGNPLIMLDAVSDTASPEAKIGDIEEAVGNCSNLLVPSSSAFLNVDPYKIEQVIRNLITNAVKFTPADGTIVIRASCVLLSHSNRDQIVSKVGVDAVGVLRVEVGDSGVGIPAENHGRVFGEFTQFNRNQLQGGGNPSPSAHPLITTSLYFLVVGGSGLGLWISRKIIHMHKGYLGFESSGRNLGSTFYFELPVYSASTAGVEASPSMDSLAAHRLSSYHMSSEGSGMGRVHLLQTAVDSDMDGMLPVVANLHPLHPSGDLGARPVGMVPQPPWPKTVDSGGGDSRASALPPEFEVEPPNAIRFLVVDDSSLNRKIITRIIAADESARFAKAKFIEAGDGGSAVDSLRSEMAAGRRVDFVLMDFVMIHMHGPEAASIMRKELNFSGIIIGVTGNALPDDVGHFISAGANEVVLKPLTKAKIIDALCRY